MYCVIMAGGKGTRFWPRSRAAAPKQLLDIISEKTMLQETIERVLPVCDAERIMIITGAQQEHEARKQAAGIPAENIIAEPVGRNTAACICLAAVRILARGDDDVMAVMPADHYIRDRELFCACLQQAGAAAAAHDVLITIGITPRSPETGYGYIQRSASALPGFQNIARVDRFIEKPDRKTAEKYIRQKNVLWNSGVFVWKASVIMRAMQQLLPDTYASLAPLQECRNGADLSRRLADAYAAIPSISIDYGVMEKARDVYVMEADFGWSDIGSWTAMFDIVERDAEGNVVRGDAVVRDTRDSLIYSEKRLVAVSGLRNVIIVATEDAVLVCSREKAQDIKSVVDALERSGKTEYL